MSDKSAETLLLIFESWISDLDAHQERVLVIYSDFVPFSFGFTLQKMVFNKRAGEPVTRDIIHGGIILHTEFGDPHWSQHT